MFSCTSCVAYKGLTGQHGVSTLQIDRLWALWQTCITTCRGLGLSQLSMQHMVGSAHAAMPSSEPETAGGLQQNPAHADPPPQETGRKDHVGLSSNHWVMFFVKESLSANSSHWQTNCPLLRWIHNMYKQETTCLQLKVHVRKRPN